MSDETIKTAEELLKSFSLILDEDFYGDLVNKWGAQYYPTEYTFSDEDVENLRLLNSSKKDVIRDINAMRDFYRIVVSLSGNPDDFGYSYHINYLKKLKEQMAGEVPIANVKVIANEVEKVISSSGLSPNYFDFSITEEEQPEDDFDTLSQGEVDALLNAAKPKYNNHAKRREIESELGIEHEYIRLEIELLYFYALAKKGNLYKELFTKRVYAMAMFSKLTRLCREM